MQNATHLADPIAFFSNHGCLHDAEVISIVCRPTEKTVEITIDDIDAAFVGMPSYSMGRKIALVFSKATSLYSNLEFADGITVSKAYCVRAEFGFICDFQLRYGGAQDNLNGASVRIAFERISVASLT